jgi:cytoskeleton protein RodZ
MPTPGEKLRAAREARKISIEQVVKVTRIRSYYIEAMETDDFSAMPSAVQARGFLRAYADFLGLNFETLTHPTEESVNEGIAQAQTDVQAEAEVEPEPDSEAEQETPPEAEITVESEPEQIDLPIESAKASDAIFHQIGAALSQRRELLGLTLDEIERHTRIRKANLELIEMGDFDNLPSPVQARGMLKTYTNFLDMDGETMLLRFAEGLQARRIERKAPTPTPRRRLSAPLWLRHLVSPDLIFGTVLILSVVGLILWGASRIIATQEVPDAELEAPSISEVLLDAPPTETPTPEEAILPDENGEDPGILLPPVPEDDVEQPPQETIPQPGSSVLQVNLLIRERVFLRVTVDGEIKQDGRVAPGAALVFDARERIEVLTGNGNAIQVIYNQIDQGTLGNPGEVVNRIYTLDGIQTPTPTVSPTPSNTPRFSPTPIATLTGTPTPVEIP